MREIIYKALGDSLTVGVGSKFTKGFVQKYASDLSHEWKIPVRTEVFARKRLLSEDLVDLMQDPYVQERLTYGNLFTITTGSNDLLRANRLLMRTGNPMYFEYASFQFEENIFRILDTIHQLKAGSTIPYQIRLVGLYNPYPELTYSDYWIHRWNHTLYSFEDQVVRYVHVYDEFRAHHRKLLAFKSIHPNKQGYHVIAKRLLETGL
ncbi:GDSL-type esterase/lipase family protein [Halalkalibacillus halophilus]|uniref:GDSL-type esterase/lipase family protein n=1 Tax=Halalkalibacillus halophilus TaxID=392827 RepID=UPI000401B69B|nr:GDSL-type esterase/lipase family protein [Halalkalibacillus halophilus]